ncbi:HypC/HybG/HupF family hydrogenase formation chaperone [Acetohalobium arabaticum]|uniref:Hydrogenase assembly chaperone hypC/hupF n=1 Tax=Acetohalobium arabaticum (strain ATCC 49924 / DSM 5501 / Z-7288) TaxID=574087 RepID=D9QVE5_ACEAZ|nr:HypC/HybG/HupF family hydrogenase formation chaperone [Acetohalobium arabaticum]ADL12204.1 hydrogenase assembly chaperone hypC/hupF [Acetohalobium arabaticum DSM 5501]
MCIAVPVEIIEVSGSTAVAELDGVRKRINVELVSEIEVGNYVLLHSGCAIEKIDQKQAEDTLKLLRSLAVDR